MAQLVWTPRILADLRRVRAYYTAIDPALADDIVKKISSAPSRLAMAPLSAPATAGTRQRKLSVRGLPFVVLHRVEGHVVYLLRIRHMSENWLPR